jgi:hypothetical protein
MDDFDSDISPNDTLEIRVYEVHCFRAPRVGTVKFAAGEVIGATSAVTG